ncbi:MAG: Phosphatidylglycerophosphatase A [Calditrichaeota bacterium]|nr:Phosphatidylglycerophosphatase A [Calditrichota bacterium]
MPPAAKLLTRVLGAGLGTGYVPVAQGTLASALFVALWSLLVPAVLWVELVVVAAVTIISVPLSGWGERMWGHDPGRITIDEFAGQALALLLLPERTWPWYLAAFVLFRLFDVFKPRWVRRHVETLPGGWGVTLDDTAAGALAFILLQIAGRLLV